MRQKLCFILRRTCWVILAMLTFSLISCNYGPRTSISVDIVSIEPEPVVGQVSTVTVRFVDETYDEPDVTMAARVGGVHGDVKTLWRGALQVNEPKMVAFDLCIPYPDTWRLEVGVQARLEGKLVAGDEEWRFIESDYDSAQILKPSEIEIPAEYRVTESANGSTPAASPTPEQSDNLSAACLAAPLP